MSGMLCLLCLAASQGACGPRTLMDTVLILAINKVPVALDTLMHVIHNCRLILQAQRLWIRFLGKPAVTLATQLSMWLPKINAAEHKAQAFLNIEEACLGASMLLRTPSLGLPGSPQIDLAISRCHCGHDSLSRSCHMC